MIPKIVVGGRLLLSASIPDAGADDALDDPILGFNAPESAEAKGGGFKLGRRRQINWGDIYGCGIGFLGNFYGTLLTAFSCWRLVASHEKRQHPNRQKQSNKVGMVFHSKHPLNRSVISTISSGMLKVDIKW